MQLTQIKITERDNSIPVFSRKGRDLVNQINHIFAMALLAILILSLWPF